MTAPRPPQEPWLEPEPQAHHAVDELALRYRQAGDADTRRPASRVHDAVRAHAEAVLAATNSSAPPVEMPSPAANQSRWKLSLLASVALAGLTGLLVLQFDREPAPERARALAPAAPAPAPSPAPEVQLRPLEPARVAPGAETPRQADAAVSHQKSVATEKDAAASPGATASPVQANALSRSPQVAEQSRDDEGDSRRRGRPSLTSTLPLASALQEAARKGRASQLNRLLSRGAPLDAADTAGRTPLMLATIHDHAAMVQGLLAAGADVSLVDRNGMTALQHARQLRRERIAAMIEEAS